MRHDPLYPNRPNQLGNGLAYLTRAAQLILHPNLRWFVLVPVLVNIMIFIFITGILIQQFSSLMGSAGGFMPEWMPGWLDVFAGFITGFLWTLFASILMVIYGYSFSILTNLIAAPFYGFLAEKTEALIKGSAPEPEPLSTMIPRTLMRELRKLWYFIWRGVLLGLGLFILSFTPLSIFVPIIAFLWAAWSMSIQYVDYPADNHQWGFKKMRNELGGKKNTTFGFGGLVMLGSMIPFANIFIMPIAVVGGTIYWLEELDGRKLPDIEIARKRAITHK